MLWTQAVVRFKIVEVAPYMLDAKLGAVNSKAINVNADVWAKLPGEVKTIIQEAAIDYRDHMAKVAIKLGKTSFDKYVKAGGKVTVMSDSQREAWAYGMPNIAKEWAAGLEKKGVPAKAILGSYMDTMRKAKQPIVREWDKE